MLTEEVHRRRGEARFGSLVRHASDLITVIGLDGKISYQSPSIERLLGYAPEHVTGRPFAELVHPSDGGRVRQMLADGAAVAGDQPHVVQCALVHRDGTPQQFEVNYTNLLGDSTSAASCSTAATSASARRSRSSSPTRRSTTR